MSSTVISNTTTTPTTYHFKSIDSDNAWKTEQKDVEEVSYSVGQQQLTVNKDKAVLIEYPEEEETEEQTAAQDSEQDAFNSEEFQKEWDLAMQNVLKIAEWDRATIFANTQKEYFEETGQKATDKMVIDAFKVFQMELESESELLAENELCDIDPAAFNVEFEEALEIVRDLAKEHQEQLVNAICNISQDLCGRDPDEQQLSEIFARIKNEFAEEATEDFLEFYERSEDEEDEEEEDEEVEQEANDATNNEDDEDDDDYSPESDTFDYSKDIEEDQFPSGDD